MEIDDHVLKRTCFMPLKRMRKVIEKIENEAGIPAKQASKPICTENLDQLQQERMNNERCRGITRFNPLHPISSFAVSCNRAIYSHNWDQLLYLLKRVPYWKLAQPRDIPVLYPRFLHILLTYHPGAISRGVLNEYLHMVWGCRSDVEKKAVLKVMLSLNKKMHRRADYKSSRSNSKRTAD